MLGARESSADSSDRQRRSWGTKSDVLLKSFPCRRRQGSYSPEPQDLDVEGLKAQLRAREKKKKMESWTHTGRLWNASRRSTSAFIQGIVLTSRQVIVVDKRLEGNNRTKRPATRCDVETKAAKSEHVTERRLQVYGFRERSHWTQTPTSPHTSSAFASFAFC